MLHRIPHLLDEHGQIPLASMERLLGDGESLVQRLCHAGESLLEQLEEQEAGGRHEVEEDVVTLGEAVEAVGAQLRFKVEWILNFVVGVCCGAMVLVQCR